MRLDGGGELESTTPLRIPAKNGPGLQRYQMSPAASDSSVGRRATFTSVLDWNTSLRVIHAAPSCDKQTPAALRVLVFAAVGQNSV